jgi:hypothetical protein
MWKRLLLSTASIVLSFFIAVAGPALAATDISLDSGDTVCMSAEKYLSSGELDLAQSLYASIKPPNTCAINGQKKIREHRRKAAEAVTEGQLLIRSGDLEKANGRFEFALSQDAGNSAALAGIKRLMILEKRPIPTASSNWDRFYDEWITPVVKLLVTAAVSLGVLMAASGILTRFVVKVGAISWKKGERIAAGTAGVLLILFTAVMLPTYAMFKPFAPSNDLLGGAAVLVLLVALIIVGLIATVSERLGKQVWADWKPLLLSLAGVVAVAIVLFLTALSSLSGRLLVAYVVLALFGVLVTAAVLGQNLRLQVEAQSADGKADTASSDYLLARMQSLGTEAPKGLLAFPTATPLSRLSAEDLSALPAGPIASALSRIFYILRPDLTWRARVTLVDTNRLTISLSRNGRLAKNVIFSRRDLGLPAIGDGQSEIAPISTVERARAQLLTGAAAVILLHLSKVHPILRQDLCGATKWKSVTLQVIATSTSLIDNPDQKVALLARAVNEDPGYVVARFEYLWAVHRSIPSDARDYRQSAEMCDRQIQETPAAVKALDGWRLIYVRALYKSAAFWVNQYVISGYRDNSALDRAKHYAEEVADVCQVPDGRRGGQLGELLERIFPFIEVLKSCVSVLDGEPVPEADAYPHANEFPAPALAYDHACLHCFMLEKHPMDARVPQWSNQAIEDLRIALVTEDDRQEASTDPCFRKLALDPRFRKLVGTADFLGLPMFAACRAQLISAGLTTAYDLAQWTESDAQLADLATHLNVSRITIKSFRDVALLAQYHPDLDDPALLHIFLSSGVNSPGSLRRAVLRDAEHLVRTVFKAAEKRGLSALRGVQLPEGWLVAAGLSEGQAQDVVRSVRTGPL